MATLLDTSFPGADENPLAAPFASATGIAAGLRKVSNQAAASAASVFSVSYDASNTYPQDHEATIYFGAVGGRDCGPAVRASGSGCYFMNSADGVNIRVYKRAGTFYELGAVVGVAYNAANRYTLRATGGTPTTLKVYENGVQVGSDIVDDGETYGPCLTSGAAGMAGYDGTFRFSRFVGADLSAPDSTPPTLSGPTGTTTGHATATGTVTTNEGNGTLYAVVTTSATAPTAAQIRAGQNHLGASAAWSGNQAVTTATGAKTFNATGLTGSTTYYFHFHHRDSSSNDSAVASSASFTTDAAPVAPTISVQPTNQTVVAPGTATFSVTASGTPSPTYQWQRSTNGGAAWSNIAGATASSYTTPATTLTGGTANNNDLYRVSVSNAAGTVVSDAATLTVQTVPTVATQPANQSVVAGSPATFTVAFNGNPAPTIQWQRSTDGGASWSNISGATGTSYATPNATVSGGSANDGDLYRAVATNAAGTVNSNVATLTVSAAGVAPAVASHPVNQTVGVGAAATFSAVFTGTPTPTVQWQVSTDGGSTWGNVSGATGLSYTTPAATAPDNGKQYRCVATNSAGTITSTAATLTVNAFTVSAGPCFRNTGDGVPIVTGTLSYTLVYAQIGAYQGATQVDGTTTPHPSTGLLTITGLPLAGAADLLVRNSDGTAIFYQRVTAA